MTRTGMFVIAAAVSLLGLDIAATAPRRYPAEPQEGKNPRPEQISVRSRVPHSIEVISFEVEPAFDGTTGLVTFRLRNVSGRDVVGVTTMAPNLHGSSRQQPNGGFDPATGAERPRLAAGAEGEFVYAVNPDDTGRVEVVAALFGGGEMDAADDKERDAARRLRAIAEKDSKRPGH
jgi:hypothetical protein